MFYRRLSRRRFAAGLTLAVAGGASGSRFAPVVAQEATPAASGEVTLGWSDELVDDNGKLNVVPSLLQSGFTFRTRFKSV